jgi:RNA polymerase sigma-70 factor (ECF subfamily)
MSTPDLRTDKELFLLLQRGDGPAYTEIFNRYSRVLVAHAYRFLSDRAAAHDVVQDIFLTLWQKRESIQLHGSFSAYLYTATRNRIFDQISRQQVIDRYVDSVMQFIEKGGVPSDERVIEKELIRLIEREIQLLPEKSRLAFILRKKQELGYDEIAAELGVSEAAAKQLVYNAVKALRLKLGRFVSLLLF